MIYLLLHTRMVDSVCCLFIISFVLYEVLLQVVAFSGDACILLTTLIGVL